MILSFKTVINDKPTYFPEKIITGLFQKKIISRDKTIELFNPEALMKLIPMEYHGTVKDVAISQIKFDNTISHIPKFHTIRKDESKRWGPEVMIDFFINARTKLMFRFAPRIPVISTQNIRIKRYNDLAQVFIDNIWFGDAFFNGFNKIDGHNVDLETLALNDGFESVDDFFKYFDSDFKGKIIHWTDLKY